MNQPVACPRFLVARRKSMNERERADRRGKRKPHLSRVSLWGKCESSGGYIRPGLKKASHWLRKVKWQTKEGEEPSANSTGYRKHSCSKQTSLEANHTLWRIRGKRHSLWPQEAHDLLWKSGKDVGSFMGTWGEGILESILRRWV